MKQMRMLDSAPLFAIGDGDFTNSGTTEQWDAHISVISTMFDPKATKFGGTVPRYLGVLGNHDTIDANWFAAFRNYFPGQADLGQSSVHGIYYSFTHQNALFVVRDSEHTSDAKHSYADAQTADLAATLQNSTAQFKFMFFHRPVYSCSMYHTGFDAGLPWVDLAEKNGVDVVFTGHTHVYARSCPMKGARCTADGTGTVHVSTGSLGGKVRYNNAYIATVDGTDATGTKRSDEFDCVNSIVAAQDCGHDFCHVRVDGCRATVSCYMVEEGNTTPFDTWTIDHCQPQVPVNGAG
jgi:predicted phosphodiesterase